VAGYGAKAGRIELPVDNFSTKKFFNDFKAQSAKSLEMRLFDHFQFLSSWRLQLTSTSCNI
jgi:hypothetical protein